jgi:tetratricopeptide (TPR) repeat protein
MDLVSEFHRASAVHGYLAWYLSQIGQQDEALEHSRQAAALSPRSYTASLIHFHVLWAAGRRIDALDEMKRFVAIRPCATEYRALLDGWRDEEDQDDGKIIDDLRRCLTNGGSAE